MNIKEMREFNARHAADKPKPVKKPHLTTSQMREELAKLEQTKADTRIATRCPSCGFEFRCKPSRKGRVVGALTGAAAGAARATKGLAIGGRIVTVVRVLHGALQGAVSGSKVGSHFDKTACPKCNTSFLAP